MTMSALEGRLSGVAHSSLNDLIERFDGYLADDPDMSIQMAAYHRGELVLDVWAGPHLGSDSLMVPYSVSKISIGVVIALLVQRGILDLDETVAAYWPEFAQNGKRDVTVRQLLSHQAGVPDAWPVLTRDELLHDHLAAERLAATWPLWRPGSGFGYHGLTIGNLASELVFRTTGSTLQQYYEREVRAPLAADFYLGLPPALDPRRVATLPMHQPEGVPRDTHPIRSRVFGTNRADEPVDLANDEVSWRFGNASVSATVSARGIARLLAGAMTGVEGTPSLLGADTVSIVSEQQVRGHDLVLDQPDRAHGIVFQRQSAQLAWGGPRSFGHDGAAGCIGSVDPETGVAFGFTIARGVWPGGGDTRAIDAARLVGTSLAG